jgi:hypothetical protein
MTSIVALAIASWETVYRRTMLMASGSCSIAEYQLMMTEKMEASQASMVTLMAGGSGEAVIAPYLAIASANAKRLRTYTKARRA